ncbi:hypothetical protein AALP_AAs72293U000100 [Arabis alpina]|uniref:Uncharacterized protein n=1 Tax=Arabis alpina TaxID=50452 RepID=A0A087FWK3_ARAAL|nr:hypothetical protein AALP_AAs72293U000100 [Arabis alpina]
MRGDDLHYEEKGIHGFEETGSDPRATRLKLNPN